MKHFSEQSKALLAAFLVVGLSSGLATGAQAHERNDRDGRVHRGSRAKGVAVRGIPHPQALRVARVHPQFGRVDIGLYRRGSVWIARPAAPRAFVVRRGRVTIVRPVPIWNGIPAHRRVSVDVRYRSDDDCAAFNYWRLTPDYGCAFCEESFPSYGDWERHSRGCAHDEIRGRASFQSWDADDLDYFQAQLEVSHVFG